MFSFPCKLLNIVRVAATLLVMAQPVLAADCRCCLENDQAIATKPCGERKACTKRCCGHKSEKPTASTKPARTEHKPCQCPDECPCHLRHNAKVIADRIETATDQLDVLGDANSCPHLHLATQIVHAQSLAPAVSHLNLRTVISSKEFCARICRLTI